jgi:hypothetical protein
LYVEPRGCNQEEGCHPFPPRGEGKGRLIGLPNQKQSSHS